MLYNILSVTRISRKQNCWKNIWGWENDLGLRQGSPFRSTHAFSHICFVSRHYPLTGNTCFTIVKQSLYYPIWFKPDLRLLCPPVARSGFNQIVYYQKCVYNVKTMFVCVCWAKQLTPPTFSPCILVKLKCQGEKIVTNPLQKSLVFNQRRLQTKSNLARVPDGRFGWR